MTPVFGKAILPAAMGLTIGLLLAPSSGLAQGGQMPPAVVTTQVISPETVTLKDTLPGRVSAYRTVQIRPQVGGIIEKRLFEQGAFVDEGQPLFQIVDKSYRAQVENASAALENAEAALDLAKIELERAKQLFEKKSASQQTYDSAVAGAKSAEAQMKAARAALETQKINLDYTTIRSPISGVIGAALVSEGALVSASQATSLAVVRQIDQVYIDLRRPATDLIKMQRAAKDAANNASDEPSVEILDVDGNVYPIKGRALFTDLSVDEATGDVTVRVLVDNPNHDLLPGMFVRAVMPRETLEQSLLVPQQAIIRNAKGEATLVIVGEDKLAHIKMVKLGELVGRRYIVHEGLEPNSAVIVRGQTRVSKDGSPVMVAPPQQANR
ncbi:efflux RND transporter periplasmic adaptor subunit [uncultured Cohaesibacter sp.]|uniref:efflux RND transporter periplasmic adaptor subunit n=1 Tax=uncultured Cohaesibacter sp. TaxID=1002546 RepID=UPI00292EDA27|nr:efflux RND transporter periplasmic adaptor subunit [uncultured Cohaesibacter sp.]